MAKTLEEIVMVLEAEMARLKHEDVANDQKEAPWWKKIRGAFKDDPAYDEISRLGAEYRRAQPIAGRKRNLPTPNIFFLDTDSARLLKSVTAITTKSAQKQEIVTTLRVF